MKMPTRPCVALIGLLIALSAEADAQTIPEIARTKPANPVVRGVLRDVTTASIDTLAKEASLVVVGRLVWSKSYLTADQMNVLSDYTILPEQVIVGRTPVSPSKPGEVSDLTLTLYGGEVTIDGVTVSAVDHNVELPKSGERFLLFLKPFGLNPGRYQVTRGAIFEVQGEKMRTLLKRAEVSSPYRELTEKSLSAAAMEIARARR